jgi:hypothetical protein
MPGVTVRLKRDTTHMPGLFISYRRDDSAGFAGRLADDLSEVFGPDLIFMDVTGIEPGIDFRKAVERKVGDCAAVLVVIGRSWLGGRGSDGVPRLQDPADLVRLEVAAALRRDIPVIPVLVDGAAMPQARDLPADVEPLAWRNAVELRHARWDADRQVLVAALQKLLPRNTAAPEVAERAPAAELPRAGTGVREKRPFIWALAAAAALLSIVALLWLRPWRTVPDARVPDAVPDVRVSDARGSDARVPDARVSDARVPGDPASLPPINGGSNGAYPATLPVAADVTVGSSRFQVLSATVDRDDAEHLRLLFLVRLTNLGATDVNFWNDSFRLVADDVSTAPAGQLNELVDGYSAKEGEVAFQVAAGAKRVALQVRGGNETTRIPVDLTARVRETPAPPARKKLPGPFPMTIASGMQVRSGGMGYRILSAGLRRRNMERLELYLIVRATNHGEYQANFSDATFRLEVDGIPRAPVSRLNELVDGNSARDGEVVFVVYDTIETLVLLVGHSNEKTRVPLDLRR